MINYGKTDNDDNYGDADNGNKDLLKIWSLSMIMTIT